MTSTEVLKKLKSKIDAARLNKCNYVIETSDIEAINQALLLYDVVRRSEQLTCPRCKSTNILNPDKDNDAQCIECAFIWAG